LCNILSEYSIRKKLVRLIKKCLNETYNSLDKQNLYDMFRIKNGLIPGDALSLLLFRIAFVYEIRTVHVNQ
jgi:hypothetical protein